MKKNFDIIYKKMNSNYYSAIKKFVKSKELKELNSGFYATVYAKKNSNYVYKIGVMNDTVKNDPYLNYILYGVKDSSLFPKIEKVTIVSAYDKEEKYTTQFYIVKMERLQKYSKAKVNAVGAKQVKLFTKIHENYYYEDDFMKKMMKKHKGSDVVPVIKNLNKLFDSFDQDLHIGNMMVRPNGELVITDPVA